MFTFLPPFLDTLLTHLQESLNARLESAQIGFLGVLARAPGFLFVGNVEGSLKAIGACCKPAKNTLLWGNARQSALSALAE